MAVTVQDIADAAGTSVATVSRTLRGLNKRRTPVQQRILEVSEQLGYCGRSGRPPQFVPQTGQVLFLESAVSQETLANDIAFGPMFAPLTQAVEAAGLNLVVSNLVSKQAAPPVLQRPSSLKGVLIHGPFSLAFFEQYLAGLPVVGLQYWRLELPCSWAMVDNASGMYQAVAHLHENGHRRIGFLANEIERMHSAQRYRGFQDAMASFELPIEPHWLATWQRSMVDGVPPHQTSLPDFTQRLKPLFKNPRQAPTAIIAAGDWQALAVITSLRSLELRVPEDVSVMGFGHAFVEQAPYHLSGMPRLSGIDDCQRAVAAAAGRLLVDQIENDTLDTMMTVKVRPRLVEGQTVAPPRAE